MSQVSLVVRWKCSPDAPSWHPSSEAPARAASSLFMWQEKRVAKEELVKTRYREHDVSAVADAVLADLGLTTQICNRFYASLYHKEQQQAQQQAQRPPPPAPAPPSEVPSPAPRTQSNQEPLSHLRDLRSRWELRLCAAVAKATEKARGPPPATGHLPPAPFYLPRAICYLVRTASHAPPTGGDAADAHAALPAARARQHASAVAVRGGRPDRPGRSDAAPEPQRQRWCRDSGLEPAQPPAQRAPPMQSEPPRAAPPPVPLHASPAPAPAPTSTPNEPTPSPPTPTPRSPPPPPRCQAMPSCSSATATSHLRREA